MTHFINMLPKTVWLIPNNSFLDAWEKYIPEVCLKDRVWDYPELRAFKPEISATSLGPT